MTQHVDISDPNIHEPKGVSSATDSQTYISDGGGSGAWKTLYLSGSEDDNSSLAAQTLTSDKVYLLNDAQGPFTTSTNRLPNRTDVWDTVNNRFDWASAGYQIGDQVTVRLDVTLAHAANSELTAGITLAEGGSSYDLVFFDYIPKAAGTLTSLNILMTFDLGDSNTLDNYARIFVGSDNPADSVLVNGFRTFIQPRSPIYD